MGIGPTEWEDMTPASFGAYVKGYLQEQETQQELLAAQNYRLAAIVRAAIWAKHMPPYETFAPKKKRQKAMTDDEMYQSVLALNTALGGRADGG